jgi:hypothetical protein
VGQPFFGSVHRFCYSFSCSCSCNAFWRVVFILLFFMSV